MSETEQPADLIELQAQMNDAVGAAVAEAVQRVMVEIIQRDYHVNL